MSPQGVSLGECRHQAALTIAAGHFYMIGLMTSKQRQGQWRPFRRWSAFEGRQPQWTD